MTIFQTPAHQSDWKYTDRNKGVSGDDRANQPYKAVTDVSPVTCEVSGAQGDYRRIEFGGERFQDK